MTNSPPAAEEHPGAHIPFIPGETAQFCWPDHRLIVQFHEPDADEETMIEHALGDADFIRRGWRVWRFPAAMIERGDDRLMRTIESLLGMPIAEARAPIVNDRADDAAYLLDLLDLPETFREIFGLLQERMRMRHDSLVRFAVMRMVEDSPEGREHCDLWAFSG